MNVPLRFDRLDCFVISFPFFKLAQVRTINSIDFIAMKAASLDNTMQREQGIPFTLAEISSPPTCIAIHS